VYIDGNSFAYDGLLHLTSTSTDIIRAGIYRANWENGQEEPVFPGDAVLRYSEIGLRRV